MKRKYWRLTIFYPDGEIAHLYDYDLFFALFYVQTLKHVATKFKLERR